MASANINIVSTYSYERRVNMSNILSREELFFELDNLRDLIQNFDYSELENVTFLNLESLFTYIAEVEDNPFQRQYEALEAALDKLEPFIPFTSRERARGFLIKMNQVETNEEIEWLKEEFSNKVRNDFVNMIRLIDSEEEWLHLKEICEILRQSKEYYHTLI